MKEPIKTAYHFGYQGQSPDSLLAAVTEKGAVLCDIRLVPYSRQAGWNKKRLVEQFGDAYRHIPELGNLNYKNGKPVQIADLGAGLEVVLEILDSRPVVVMCVCRDFSRCHRRVVAEELEKRGVEVSELILKQDSNE